MKTTFYNTLYLFSIFIMQIVNSFNCSWHYSSNVSYNLCGLQLTNETMLPKYTVNDKRSTQNVSMFSYEFNICDVVQDSPFRYTHPHGICTNITYRTELGLNSSYCDNIVNFTCKGNMVPIENTTAAYQIETDVDKCFRLHDGVTPPTWRLYQADDPVSGVVLTYINGDWCKSGRNREFRVAFICEDDYANTFDKQEIIEETEVCIYETTIKSIWGCPEQCKVVNERLCAGNGVCDFDFTNKYPKCFCYTGFYGDDCTLTQDDSISTIYKDDDAKYVGLLIIIVILLVIVLTIFFYLWLRFTNTKYMIPKSKSLLSNQNDDDNKKKVSKKQKQQSESVQDESDEENNVVV